MMRIARFPPLFAVIILAGCAGLFHEEAPLQHYTLGATAPSFQAQSTNGELDGLSVGLRRLRLAEHLETHFIILRSRSHQVRFSDHHRWAGELHRDINRAMASYLADHARFGRVDVAPWPPHAQHDYLIQINVQRFEGLTPEAGAESGEAHLLADWEVVRSTDREVVARGTTEHRQAGWATNDYTALVSMLDEGLRVMTSDIVDELEEVASGEGVEVEGS